MSLFSFLRRAARHPAPSRPSARPRLEALEDRMVPANIRVVGTQIGPPHVKVFAGDRREIADFFAFDPAVTSGARVGVFDVNNDGLDDYICGAGDGALPRVVVV